MHAKQQPLRFKHCISTTVSIKFFLSSSGNYYDDFPHLALLEENLPAIRAEAAQLLDSNVHLPHRKDLYGRKRAGSKVYKADWMTYWFQMGRFLPENCARTPKLPPSWNRFPVWPLFRKRRPVPV
jgi:hypothetical protein